MDKVLNMQTSFFGSFIDIKLETEIVIKLLTALKDDGFVPGSADITSVDLKTGKMFVDSRLQLVSTDKTWSIVFLPDRIDFNYNYQQGTSVCKNIDGLLITAKELIEKVFSVFSGTIGNRLALNCRFALENMTEDDLSQFCNRFTKPLSAYNQESFVEWSVRFNSRGKCKISEDKEEECNRITEMMQMDAQQSPIQGTDNHGVVLSIDVNTLQQNMSQRFQYNHLIRFDNEAAKFIADITKEVEGC